VAKKLLHDNCKTKVKIVLHSDLSATSPHEPNHDTTLSGTPF